MRATLVVKAGLTDRKEYVLEPGRAYFIGRSRDADVIVKDQQSSRRHCKFEVGPDGQWAVTDQSSSNGTYVNRQRVTGRALQHGDLVQVGKATFEFALAGAPAPERAPAAEPAAPEPAPPQAAAPDRERAPQPQLGPEAPTPAPPSKEGRDKELQELFSFLDKIEAGDRPAAAGQKPRDPAPQEPAPLRLQPEGSNPAPPRPERGEGALFSLIEGQEASKPQAQPGPEAPEEKKRGGLLAFLRKKKQP